LHYLDWGLVSRELIGISDGATRRFHTRWSPVLSKIQEAGGVITDDETKITVETFDPSSGDSFTTVATSAYDLNGSKGEITFNLASIPTEGLEIYCSYKYDLMAIRRMETSLACALLSQSMPGGTDIAEVYQQKYEQEYQRFIEGKEWNPQELGKQLYEQTRGR